MFVTVLWPAQIIENTINKIYQYICYQDRYQEQGSGVSPQLCS